MSTRITVGVLGATGALGKELLSVLDRSPWRPDEVVPFASRATQIPYVSYGDSSVAVEDFSAGALGELDLLFLTAPSEACLAAAAIAADEGVPVVDASGALSDDGAPLVVPWVNPEVLQTEEPLSAVSIPSAGASLLGATLAPLLRAGLVRDVDATLLLPASHWGRRGLDELSAQVVAMFNSGTPPRKVFESGLAFDLLPLVGSLGASGRSSTEDRIIIELSELLGLRQAPRVEVLGVPVFSGITATVRVALTRQTDPGLVHRILIDGGLKVSEDVRSLPRPRRVEGKPFPDIGRLRLEEDRLTLLAGFDNLRGSAAAAVAAGGVLLRQRGVELGRDAG